MLGFLQQIKIENRDIESLIKISENYEGLYAKGMALDQLNITRPLMNQVKSGKVILNWF